MKKISTLYYLIKRWLLVILVTPLLFPLTTLFYGSMNWKLYPVLYFGSIVYGSIFSLPTFIACLLICKLMIGRPLTDLLIKTIITSIALTGMLATIYVWQGSFGYSRADNYMALVISIMYSATIVIFGLVGPLFSRSRPVSNTSQTFNT